MNDVVIDAREVAPSITLSEDQAAALDAVFAWLDAGGHEPLTLGGLAGTGKSTLIKQILVNTHMRIAVCAYTGKAAHVLRGKGVDQARTIHSLIYLPQTACKNCGTVLHDGTDVCTQTRECFGAGTETVFDLAPALVYDLIIVDEASMVSTEIHEDLTSFGIPVLYVGDHGQLEPIGSNPRLMVDPQIRLERIHRQAAESPILQFAHHVRNHHAPTTFGPEARVVETATVPADAHEFDIVLCGKNSTRVALNGKIRKAKGFAGDLPEPGERIVCLRNCKKYAIFNGMLATVVEVHADDRMDVPEIDIVDDDNKVTKGIRFAPEQFGCEDKLEHVSRKRALFDFGYALTVHKCVAGDTLVQTGLGWRRMDDIGAEAGRVATVTGAAKFTRHITRREGPLLRLRCEQGYSLTVTPDHKLRIFDDDTGDWVWREARDLDVGDYLRLHLGNTRAPATAEPAMPVAPPADVRSRKIDIPATLTGDLAEFLGLMVADGSLYRSGFRLAKRYIDVVDRYDALCTSMFGLRARRYEIQGTPAAEFNSRLVADWLRRVGGMEPHCKTIPAVVLGASPELRARFLRGLFEDGTVNVKRGIVDHIEWANVDFGLVRTVQTLLLEYGVICSTKERERVSSLYIYGDGLDKFRDLIGFVSAAKNARLRLPFAARPGSKYRVPICRADYTCATFTGQTARAKGYVSRATARDLGLVKELDFHYVRITEIEKTKGKSFCLEVPSTGSFLQNGFDGSNSQGSSWKRVLVLEWIHRETSAARWRYTAATRAEQELVYCVSPRRRLR